MLTREQVRRQDEQLTEQEQLELKKLCAELRMMNAEARINTMAAQMDAKRREQKQTRTAHFAKAGYEVKASGQYVATKHVPKHAHETKSRNVQEKRCQLFAQRCEDKLKRGF